jgi:hypothetical protein
MPDHHQVLLDLDGVRYRTRITVERVDAGADPSADGRYECNWPDWPASWPGRLAAAHADVQRLLSLNAELGAQIIAARRRADEDLDTIATLTPAWEQQDLLRRTNAELGATLDAYHAKAAEDDLIIERLNQQLRSAEDARGHAETQLRLHPVLTRAPVVPRPILPPETTAIDESAAVTAEIGEDRAAGGRYGLVPCRYCGAGHERRALSSHERACAQNPNRFLPNVQPKRPCPRCGNAIGKNNWKRHTAQCEGGPAIPWPEPAEGPELAEAGMDEQQARRLDVINRDADGSPFYRCPQCQRTAFAQSTRGNYCMGCAAEADQAARQPVSAAIAAD